MSAEKMESMGDFKPFRVRGAAGLRGGGNASDPQKVDKKGLLAVFGSTPTSARVENAFLGGG